MFNNVHTGEEVADEQGKDNPAVMRQPIPEWTQGERMAKLRKTAGLTREQMAEECGLSTTTITNWEHDKVRVPRLGLMAYAQRLSDHPSAVLEWLINGVVDITDQAEAHSPCDSPDWVVQPMLWDDQDEYEPSSVAHEYQRDSEPIGLLAKAS